MANDFKMQFFLFFTVKNNHFVLKYFITKHEDFGEVLIVGNTSLCLSIFLSKLYLSALHFLTFSYQLAKMVVGTVINAFLAFKFCEWKVGDPSNETSVADLPYGTILNQYHTDWKVAVFLKFRSWALFWKTITTDSSMYGRSLLLKSASVRAVHARKLDCGLSEVLPSTSTVSSTPCSQISSSTRMS